MTTFCRLTWIIGGRGTVGRLIVTLLTVARPVSVKGFEDLDIETRWTIEGHFLIRFPRGAHAANVRDCRNRCDMRREGY